MPAADGAAKTYPPHINEIVDKISQLTLMEVADLNSCLKVSIDVSVSQQSVDSRSV